MIRTGANRVALVGGERVRQHLPEAHDDKDRLFHTGALARLAHHPGVEVDADGNWSFLKHVTYRVQAYQSCVGWDLAQKVELCDKVDCETPEAKDAGREPLPFTSPLYNYDGSRLLGEKNIVRKPDEGLLEDWGCSCRYAMMSARDNGMVRETAWSEQEHGANDIPPADIFQRAGVARLKDFYRIPDGPTAKSIGAPLPTEQIDAAALRGFPPGGCMIVDEKYGEIGRELYSSPGGKVQGGHAQTLAAKRRIRGRVAYGAISTWGTDVGDAGIFWIDAEFINRFWYDLWVVRAVPKEIV